MCGLTAEFLSRPQPKNSSTAELLRTQGVQKSSGNFSYVIEMQRFTLDEL